ncbi:serine/threonine-protein kinase, partial [Streptomyces calidiresistens]
MEPLTPDDPRAIGDYRLIARLGEGGMGNVYLARSPRGRTVAVKTIRSILAGEPDFRRRFAQEITAARRVGDTWTAPVLDADPEADVPWVATGYIAGPSLHDVVTGRHGPLPERSVLILAHGLTRALGAIHGAGLIHRDLKPSNILLTIDGPRVIDFGIARVLESTAPGVTRTGSTVGSPGFMSPEQVRGETLTPASDVFCLGSVLAYAATGRTPFGSTDSGLHVLLFRVAEEEPDLDELPDGLRALVADCLAKDPAARPATEALAERLAPVAEASREPWLPGALIAQLGRHAVELLNSEDPMTGFAPVAGPAPAPSPPPAVDSA